MKQPITAKSVLHQLGIGKSYSGYDYVLYALELISLDSNSLTCITKVLYSDVARKFQTSNTCVERNIRKVIEVIWKNAQENQYWIEQIFGARCLKNKPSNKEFLELLHEYVKSYDAPSTVCHIDKMICPIFQECCIAYEKMLEKYLN